MIAILPRKVAEKGVVAVCYGRVEQDRVRPSDRTDQQEYPKSDRGLHLGPVTRIKVDGGKKTREWGERYKRDPPHK